MCFMALKGLLMNGLMNGSSLKRSMLGSMNVPLLVVVEIFTFQVFADVSKIMGL